MTLMNANNRALRVLVVDDDRNTRDNLRNLLELEDWVELVGMAGDAVEAVDIAVRLSPDVVLMDYYLPGGTGAQVAERLRPLLPTLSVIMMSVETSPDVMREALLAGAKDFLTKPIASQQLFAALRRLPRRADDPTTAVATSRPQSAHVIAVHSPKGGVGTSTFAVNLAIAKRLETNARVAVVDLNLAYGDVGLLMDVSSSTTIYDLSLRLSELDATLLHDVMVTHPSGVQVLLAPSEPQQAEAITGTQLRRILTEMVATFDYVIMDTPSHLSEPILVALDMAHTVLAVSTQDVPSVRDTKLFLNLAQLLDYPQDKVKLVLNRVNSYSLLKADSIEQRLGVPMVGQVPEELKTFSYANGSGVPVVVSARGSAAAREISRIAAGLGDIPRERAAAAGEQPTTSLKPARRGLLARMRA